VANVNPIQVQKYLGGLDYPASKDDVVDHARNRGADDNIISTLQQMKEEQFQTPAEVSQAIGEVE
jgi:hypothetical protein